MQLPRTMWMGAPATALQLNKSLHSVAWDHNGASVGALHAFAIALARNRSMVMMALPLSNIGAALAGTRGHCTSARMLAFSC